MNKVNLLKGLPKGKRTVSVRADKKSAENIRISRLYGHQYFDGDRKYGYGGYSYDGRWQPVAKDIIAHFGLKPGDRVLDIGAAKGFLVKDLGQAMAGLDVYGTDISSYALKCCEKEVVGQLHLHDLNTPLPFPDNSFDAVVCINTLHNLKRENVILALREMTRVVREDKIFVQVDSYETIEQQEIFLDWVLTAYTHDFPEGWLNIFREADYCGDYNWTIIS